MWLTVVFASIFSPGLRSDASSRSRDAVGGLMPSIASCCGSASGIIPPVRAWSDRHWDTAALCDWPTRAGCLHTQWKCLVGLHCDAGPGDHHVDLPHAAGASWHVHVYRTGLM